MSLKDEPIPAGEEWYYELDGRASRSDAVERSGGNAEPRGRDGFAGSRSKGSGRTLVGVPLRRANEFNADRPFPISRAIRTIGGRRGPWPPVVGAASRGASHRYSGSIATCRQLSEFGLLLNVLFILFLPEPYSKERRYLATLQDVVKQSDQLRAEGASDKDWAGLAKRTKERLAPMIADLQKSASSSELPRQQLLWSARDLAPRIMGAPTKEREDNELRLRQYLQSVEQAVGHP